ncbi:hypothetical protein EV175_004133 [Coemansia sp. RSA 1933]|nr:hypothetical protein EV175_004133 [Coemansia sp. RSA 1933]
MSQNTSSNSSSAGQSNKQGMPIPIGSAQRNTITASRNDASASNNSSSGNNNYSFQIGSDISGSQMNISGIDPPPNSLVSTSMMTSYLGSSLGGNAAHGGFSGANPPPNTPAQVSKLQQIMGRDMGGSSYEPDYGNRQTTISGSMVRRRFIDQETDSGTRFNPMNEDHVEEFNSLSLQSDNASPSSSEHDGKNKFDKYPDTLFDMDQ